MEFQGFSMPNGGFRLDFHEDSLIDVQSTIDLATNMNGRSNQMNDNRRPQLELRADANYFLTNVLGGDHATKFGIGYRDNPVGFTAIRGGRARARLRNGVPVEADLYRDSNTERSLTQLYGYLQDSYTRGKLTVNGGVRFDFQDDEALASSVPANPIIPDLLPAVDFGGADSGVNFFDVSPRLGVTYNLTGDGSTIIKGNLAIVLGHRHHDGAVRDPGQRSVAALPLERPQRRPVRAAQRARPDAPSQPDRQLRSGQPGVAGVVDHGRSQPEERSHGRGVDRHRA